MNCTEVASLLDDLADERLSCGQKVSVEMHLARCDDCEHASRAVRLLRASRAYPTPAPRAGFFEEAVSGAAAKSRMQQGSPGQGRFWLGAGFGGALAAGIVLALLTVGGLVRSPATDVPAELLVALYETRDVNIVIDSPAQFDEAEIRVLLTGSIGLAGYQGQTELRWSTALDRGTNMLRLPISMEGRSGGHLLVEVKYGEKQKTFAVRLRERSASAQAVVPLIGPNTSGHA
jgi:hypothetical protein